MPIEARRAKSPPLASHQLPPIAASNEDVRRKSDAELGSAELLRRIRRLQDAAAAAGRPSPCPLPQAGEGECGRGRGGPE